MFRWANIHLGFAHIETERRTVAKEYFIKSMQFGENNRTNDVPSLMLTLEKVRNREVTIDDDALTDNFKERAREKFVDGLVKRQVANTLLSLGDDHLAGAQSWFGDAIDTDRRQGQRWDLAMDYASYAEWFERQGDQKRARANLNTAIQMFQECGADGWVKRTEEKLARL